MDLTNFNLMDGVELSLFAMLVVFIILVILQFIVYAFKFLPRELKEKAPDVRPVHPRHPANKDQDGADEDEMVAMLTASALAKEEFKGNVRIKSIKRIG